MSYDYYIYIIASNSGTLYIGVTNHLIRRILEHKKGLLQGFAKKYDCKKLIYYEHTEDIYSALSREKQLKNWSRRKKEFLIKRLNPSWRDLSYDIGVRDSSTSLGMTKIWQK